VIDVLAPGAAATLVHVGARVGGMVMVAPVFSARVVPVRVRVAVLVLLTALLYPAAAGGAPPRITLEGLLGETLIGFAIGFGAAVFLGAAEVAGEYLSIQIGLSGAAILDPTSGNSTPVLGQFVQMTVLTLLLASDAHLEMIRAVADSLRFLPPGGGLAVREGLAALVAQGATLFAVGLRFAAPVIATVLIANVALAVLSRVAPQVNVLAVAFPIQIGLGLVTLGAALPLLAATLGGWGMEYDATLTRLLGALAGGGG
jgi:flagellar biosynthetic protein FliR